MFSTKVHLYDFEVKFKVSVSQDAYNHYHAEAKVSGSLFTASSSNEDTAISKLLRKIIRGSAVLSMRPANRKKTAVTQPKPDPNTPKVKPSDLTKVPHPDCNLYCTSFDHFGKSKCKSMCPQKGVF